MTATYRMHEAERRQLEFRCTFCQADKGQRCTAPSGAHVKPHEARRQAALRAGRLPLR